MPVFRHEHNSCKLSTGWCFLEMALVFLLVVTSLRQLCLVSTQIMQWWANGLATVDGDCRRSTTSAWTSAFQRYQKALLRAISPHPTRQPIPFYLFYPSWFRILELCRHGIAESRQSWPSWFLPLPTCVASAEITNAVRPTFLPIEGHTGDALRIVLPTLYGTKRTRYKKIRRERRFSDVVEFGIMWGGSALPTYIDIYS